MRVVFMGTPDFAVPSLEALARAHEVVAVYTRPDAVSGRGAALRPTPVKLTALELGLPVRQPTSLREPDEAGDLRALAPDVVVVAAYGLILPREILQIPAHGCVNVHGSLLPRWRGAAPVQRAILEGDTMTGVSIMQMEEGLDTGPYCTVERVEIGDMNTRQLTTALAEAGARALIQSLELIEQGTCTWTSQDPALVTYAEKIAKHEVLLSPDLTAAQLLARVRASSRQAPARAQIAGRGVTVVDALVADQQVAPGALAYVAGDVFLGASDGAVRLVRIKPEGKQEMAASDWARGVRLSGDERWSAV